MALKKILKPSFVLLCFCLAAAPCFALSSRKCSKNVPTTIKYRPTTAACGGKATILLSGKYLRAFSVVFKKVDHGDRLGNACPNAGCSPFKAQRQSTKNGVRTICFGASGFSKVFNGTDPYKGYNPAFVVNWISIKLRNSGQLQDVEIYCLPKPYPRTPLN
jgi:hypothetical protein